MKNLLLLASLLLLAPGYFGWQWFTQHTNYQSILYRTSAASQQIHVMHEHYANQTDQVVVESTFHAFKSAFHELEQRFKPFQYSTLNHPYTTVNTERNAVISAVQQFLLNDYTRTRQQNAQQLNKTIDTLVADANQFHNKLVHTNNEFIQTKAAVFLADLFDYSQFIKNISELKTNVDFDKHFQQLTTQYQHFAQVIQSLDKQMAASTKHARLRRQLQTLENMLVNNVEQAEAFLIAEKQHNVANTVTDASKLFGQLNQSMQTFTEALYNYRSHIDAALLYFIISVAGYIICLVIYCASFVRFTALNASIEAQKADAAAEFGQKRQKEILQLVNELKAIHDGKLYLLADEKNTSTAKIATYVNYLVHNLSLLVTSLKSGDAIIIEIDGKQERLTAQEYAMTFNTGDKTQTEHI